MDTTTHEFFDADQAATSANLTVRERLAAEAALATPSAIFVLGSGLGGVVDLLDARPRVRVTYGDSVQVGAFAAMTERQIFISTGGATIEVEGMSVHTTLNEPILQFIAFETGGQYYNGKGGFVRQLR